jgi:hypothetical protein
VWIRKAQKLKIGAAELETKTRKEKTMNTASKGGLFARQKITNKIKALLHSAWERAKRSMLLVTLAGALIVLSSCDKQINGQNADGRNKDQALVAGDTVNKPKINIQVNRRYDEKGTMIGFDSTYSTFYSNVEGDTFKMDSLMHSFDSYFNRHHSSFFNRQLDPLFFDDSLRYPDFFHDDFFMRRYESNDEYMKGMMERMDSIKNRFFYEHSNRKKNPKDIL